jgi:hypothetical protein
MSRRYRSPDFSAHIKRRALIRSAAVGLGSLGIGSLFPTSASTKKEQNNIESPWRGVIENYHYIPRAKRVIHLCMAGGPSQHESFDYKPKLREMNGKEMPSSLTEGQQLAQLQGQKMFCKGSHVDFKPCGDSGQVISDMFPFTQEIADEICIIRSMQTEQINHDTAHALLSTGSTIKGKPSMGSWLLYGLGSESRDLPGYIVLESEGGGQGQPVSSRNWHSGFLPGNFQGVQFQNRGAPIHYMSPPSSFSRSDQRKTVEIISELNSQQLNRRHDPELETRILQYEMAMRMQSSVPKLVNFNDEPQHILDMYGATGMDGSFASNCLLARRMAERGVRFIQLYHRGWDHHDSIEQNMPQSAAMVDRASAALVRDLKQRGMLEDTLVVWGGEFGRTPMAQGSGNMVGRDHHIKAFSIWMAGAGIKPGFSYGLTDEFGYDVVENPVQIRDLHATLLYLFGIDHKHFTFPFQGLDSRLTGVSESKIIHDLVG